MMYGQFAADRPGLREFYTAGGFRVLDRGASLPIGMATGRHGDVIAGEPTDCFFEWSK
jgi:hypothetical protein